MPLPVGMMANYFKPGNIFILPTIKQLTMAAAVTTTAISTDSGFP